MKPLTGALETVRSRMDRHTRLLGESDTRTHRSLMAPY